MTNLDSSKVDSMDNRDSAKALFDYYKTQGQIAFITFHQSFSYEEFVEGIKPTFVSDENDNENVVSKNMVYEVQDGIFKELCNKALKNYEDSQKEQEQVIEELDTEYLLESFISHIEENQDIICDGFKFIRIGEGRAVKIYGTDKRWILLQKPENKTGKWLGFGAILKYYNEYKKDNNIQIPSPQINKYPNGIHTDNNLYVKFFKELQKFEEDYYKKPNFEDVSNELKPYILIIDEINRGNISKILGELITLIEPSKRIGNDEALSVNLPYSQDEFGVPKNLYIIGTMNTADRSIALLDTALRRRFEFVELMPDFSKLSKDCESVNLQKLLESINNRIEFLLDREHTIGHAYFINAKTLEDLKTIFAKKIIPLLQEYFYDDYSKINAVLNDNKMIESKSMKNLGVNLSDDFVDSEKRIYKITDSKAWKVEDFINIYKKNNQSNED